jgi:ribosomal protein S18 acetylase RimI-like enzyme
VSANPITIREARARDARDLVALQQGIYDEGRYFVGDGPPAVELLYRRLQGLEPARSLYLVACRSRELLGWLELHRLQAKRLQHVAMLTLAVAASARRQGIASRLLAESYRWAAERGVVKIQLNVRAGNQAALALYKREGFVCEGREVGQIRTEDGYEDNLLMAKFLEPARESGC